MYRASSNIQKQQQKILFFIFQHTWDPQWLWGLIAIPKSVSQNQPPNTVERKWVQSIFYPWEIMTQYIYAARGVWYAINPKGIYRHIQYAYFCASKIITFPL